MKKSVFILFATFLLLKADLLEVKDFKSDIYSKTTNELQKVELSLVFEGRYLKENRYKVLDALNIVIGSFFFEDLMTSKGKEEFKNLLIKYLSKKYGIDVDDVLILRLLKSDNLKIKELVKELKKEGCCKGK